MNWNELVSALASLPALPDAACRSRAPMFDAHHDNAEMPERRSERIAIAQALCGQCPALARCRDWARTQDGGLSGVVAGELYEPRTTVGRLDTRRPANAVVEFVYSREVSTVTDVMEALNIPRTTAATALSRAAANGQIHRKELGRYGPTPDLTRIGVSA